MCTKQDEKDYDTICARKVTLRKILYDLGAGLCDWAC